MSVPARKWALSKRTGSSARRAVLNCLADWMIGENAVECWPSIDTIVFETEMNRKTVMKATAELVALGLIGKRKVIDIERHCWQTRYTFIGYVPKEWVKAERPGEELSSYAKESPKNGTYQKRYVPKTESTKNGTEVHTKNGTKVGPKNGTIESPKFGTRTGIEQGITGIRQEGKAHASRSLPRATHTREDVVEKKFDCEHADEEDDDKQSAQPVIPEEPPFDAGLFDEAQLVASGNLESFENEVNAEVVFSPDAQIPIENIEILNATASDSIFGTDTPPKDQNAAERKSEAISKPKRKRVSSSVVKDKPEDISQEVWDDWLTTRRAKRLPLTQTALNSVRREAASAGLTFQAAVTFAVEQGWAAFRAEWYRNATRKGDSTKTNARYLTAQERYEERMRKAGEMSDEEYFAQFDLPEEILNYEKAQEAKRHVAS